MNSTLLHHPERIHPALWRGVQLIQGGKRRLPSGSARLDQALGGGWPLGTLIELLPQTPGIGEVRLVRPALANAQAHCPRIVLLGPPQAPAMQCWAAWGLAPERLLWIRTHTAQDILWAASQVLHHQAGAVLLCWLNQASYAELTKLYRLAQRSAAFALLYRPGGGARSNSPARLRLALSPAPEGIQIDFLRRPPALGQAAGRSLTLHWHEDALDQPADTAAAGRMPRPAGSAVALHAALDSI